MTTAPARRVPTPSVPRRAAVIAELEARLRAMPPEPQLSAEARGIVARALAAGVPTVPGLGLEASIALTRGRLRAALADARAAGRREP